MLVLEEFVSIEYFLIIIRYNGYYLVYRFSYGRMVIENKQLIHGFMKSQYQASEIKKTDKEFMFT